MLGAVKIQVHQSELNRFYVDGKGAIVIFFFSVVTGNHVFLLSLCSTKIGQRIWQLWIHCNKWQTGFHPDLLLDK